MRPAVRPDNPLELAALAFNRAPRPVAEAMFSMMTARAVMAGQRLGLFGRLARGPATDAALAQELELDPAGARHLTDCLVAGGQLRRDGDHLKLSRRARRWLDPASDSYVGSFIDFNYDQWGWWSQLEQAVRDGDSAEIHEAPAGDPYWERYIRGQFELARVSAPEVARAIDLGDRPTSLLDVAGGHGWFAAELCRRHPGLRATVVDLPASTAVGRKIIAEQGLADRVEHREGDMFELDLGGPHDGALLFNIVHHLSPEENVRLLHRVAAALRPGGTVAVLDLFTPAREQRPDMAAFLGMHFWLTSGAATYSPADLAGWLGEAGFTPPRRVAIRRNPTQTLYTARRG